MLSKIAQQVGRIDILVNSAGISHIGRLENTWKKILTGSFRSTSREFITYAAVIQYMKAQGGGVILNIGVGRSRTWSVGPLCLFDEQRCGSVDDVVCGKRLYQAQYPLQLYFTGTGTHCICRWILAKNYPGQEKEMFDKLSKTQPIGRMGKPEEIASLALVPMFR